MAATQPEWDVIVVGAGPAGASAARAAAEAGASVLLLDKARFPRYKTCGGGITGMSRAHLPASSLATVQEEITRVGFSHRMRRTSWKSDKDSFLGMVERDVFDQANVDAAVAVGAVFQDSTNVRSVSEKDGVVTIAGSDSDFTGRVVIGADGAGGRVGRYVGVEIAKSDLGLEVELPKPPGAQWDNAIYLDWGKAKGSYAWVFPKRDRLTVGVIQARGAADETRAYLTQWLEHLGLADVTPVRDSGHLTSWRTPGSPIRRGHVVLAGESGGLLEPWSREGISYALRSGTWAGQRAAQRALGDDEALDLYERSVRDLLDPEIAAGAAFLKVFERWPGLIQIAVTKTRAGSRYFVRFSRGQVGLAQTLSHPMIHRVLGRLFR